MLKVNAAQNPSGEAELSPRPAQERSLMDYNDYFPFSHQMLFSAQFMCLLKTFGEIQRVSWKFVIIVWLLGIVGVLIRCSRRKAEYRTQQNRVGSGDNN